MAMALSARRIRQLYAWHKWTGLLGGLFIFFICLTGAIAVFKHEIDKFLTPALVVRPSASPSRAALDDVMRRVRAEYPNGKIEGIQLPKDETTAIVLSVKEGKKYTQVFADPYTGQITGSRAGETVANVIRQTHLRFYYFGWQGRVVGFFGLVLLVSTITGLFIYLPFMKAVPIGGISSYG